MGCHKEHGDHLSALPFGIALGAVWSMGVVLLGVVNMFYPWGMPVVSLLSSIYIGFEATLLGCLIGGVWAFTDGLVGGIIFVLVYRCSFKCCQFCCQKFCSKKNVS